MKVAVWVPTTAPRTSVNVIVAVRPLNCGWLPNVTRTSGGSRTQIGVIAVVDRTPGTVVVVGRRRRRGTGDVWWSSGRAPSGGSWSSSSGAVVVVVACGRRRRLGRRLVVSVQSVGCVAVVDW